MKRIFPVILLLAPYLLVFALYFPAFGAWINQMVNGLWIEVAIAIACFIWFINLYVVQKTAWSEKAYSLWNLVLKVAHMPFYACMFLIIMASPMYMFLLFWPLAMTVTATGLYGVRAIGKASKQELVSKYFVLVHMIAAYLPILDIISAIFVYQKMSTLKPKEVTA